MDPLSEKYCLELLKDLTAYLEKSYSKKKMDSKTRSQMSLSEIKIELYPWSQNYFGNLLLPEFKKTLEGFVRYINRNNIHPMDSQEKYPFDHCMKAMEFAYAREIQGLQIRYGHGEWSKNMTKAEHAVLLQNKPPLTNLEAIEKFIKGILKNKKKKKGEIDSTLHGQPPPPPRIEFMENEFPALNLGNAMLEGIIKKNFLSKITKEITEAQGGNKSLHEKKSGESQGQKRQVHLTERTTQQKIHQNLISHISTRQKRKDANTLLSLHFPVYSQIWDNEEGKDKIHQQIVSQENSMLEYMKYLNKKSKRFMKPIQLWQRGFSLLYIFWMNLIISSTLSIRKEQIELGAGEKEEEKKTSTVFSDLYSDKDDAMFLLILGQVHVDALHKKEFHTNYSSKDGASLFPTNDPAMGEEEEENHYYINTENTSGNDDSKKASTVWPLHLWRSYLLLINGMREGYPPPKWRHNYSFLTVNVFLALLRKKMIVMQADESCYTILDSAFDFCMQKKTKQQPTPISNSSSDIHYAMAREERYAAICKQITEGISFHIDKALPPKSKWLYDLLWENPWNLLGVLPKTHALYAVIAPQPPPPPSKTSSLSPHSIKKEVVILPESINESELDQKTQERLHQWWFKRPFFYRHNHKGHV